MKDEIIKLIFQIKIINQNIDEIRRNKKMEHIKSKIRTVPNWPKEGIMFRDITTLLGLCAIVLATGLGGD